VKRSKNDYEIVCYTNPTSRGRTVRWMLEEIRAPYRPEVLELGTTMKSPEFLAIKPMGKSAIAMPTCVLLLSTTP
jgi:hypothetical protein